MAMTETDFRGEQLRRRCAASGLLAVGGYAFSLLCLQFDPSTGNPAVLGIYAMVVGGVGCVTYKIRHYLHKTRHYLQRSAQRRKLRMRRRANTELIFLGGGIG